MSFCFFAVFIIWSSQLSLKPIVNWDQKLRVVYCSGFTVKINNNNNIPVSTMCTLKSCFLSSQVGLK